METQGHIGERAAEFNNPLEQETIEIAPDRRQQDKIVKYFESGDRTVIAQNEVYVGPGERQAFLDKVVDGRYTNREFRLMLLDIKPPLSDEDDPENPVGLFQQITFNRQQRGIVAELARGDLSKRNELNARDLGDFLVRYPDPIALEASSKQFLDGIERMNSPAKRAEYERSLHGLERTLYGKRQEYWEQIQQLVAQAEKKSEKVPTQETQKVNMPEVMELNAELSAQILNRAEIHGDPYRDRLLSKEILRHAELGPKHQIELGGGLKISFSDIYEYSGDRKAVVGYTETPSGQVVARSYYQSKSQGLWRYLPSYGRDGWLDKGHSEDSLNLPLEAQSLLGELSLKGYRQVENGNLIFHGTAKDYLRRQESTYQAETERSPILLNGDFYGDDRKRGLVPPDRMDFFNQDQAPDFRTPLVSWRSYSSLYGQIQFEAFASHDGKFKYIMGTDTEKHSWIAAVESGSKVASTGVREKWIAGGDLTTPLYEYDSQDGGYGGQYRGDRYQEMWSKYLSNVPVIQRYRQARGIV